MTPPWATALLGERAVCTRVIGGGTSRTTLLLEVPPRPGRVVARHDAGVGPLAGTPFTLRREAAAYASVAATGIPVPTVVAVAADGLSFAVDEVAGQVDRRAEALDDYLSILGRLHAAGVDAVPPGHEGFDRHGREDLAVWRRIADEHVSRPAPLVADALRALDRHASSIEHPVLCHGDAGFGNYLHSGQVVTGLVDWEMAHTGDAHDDLASIAVRAILSNVPLGDFRARIGWHWEPASGLRFDERRYLVGVVATLTRMVISCLVALDRPRPDTDRTTQLMGLPVMEMQLARALALLDGKVLGPTPEVAIDPAFVDEVETLLAEPVPGGDTGIERRRAYLAEQLDAARRTAARPAADADHAHQAASRLAVLPASRRLADAEIPGVIQ